MTQAEIARYREKLVTLARRITKDVANLAGETLRGTDGEASGSLSNTPLHPADLGTDTFEQEMNLSLLETEDQTLEAIKAAVDRIEQGTFGRCVRCHREIGKERLQAVPYTPFCVDCARRTESNGRPAEGDADVS